jgi:PAS domain S-box-containing protein
VRRLSGPYNQTKAVERATIKEMRKRSLFGLSAFVLALLVALLVYQGSFSLSAESAFREPYLLWGVASMIFLLMVTLGFMLFRTGLKLYIERQSQLEGSRIKTKLVIGALALSIMPVFFMLVFSLSVLGHNLNKWFSRPAENILRSLTDVGVAFEGETFKRADLAARWLAARGETAEMVKSGTRPADFNRELCDSLGLAEAYLEGPAGERQAICAASIRREGKIFDARREITGTGYRVVARARMAADLAAKHNEIAAEIQTYNRLASNRREFRAANLLLMVLISLFILFVATWIALQLARQISGPIAALVEAAGQLRQGRLSYRIPGTAMDELGTLIRAFNDMAQEIETSEGELERRRQFTETILENIPTGVISLSRERRIQHVNRAFSRMFGGERSANAVRLEDLFPAEEAREIHYLINRARRTGLAATQLEIEAPDGGKLPLAVTVSALEGRHASGFVIVIEDTSDMLRAQRAAAWHEVARRIAHEMKNPLTPIALSAERIARQIDRLPASTLPPETVRIVRECTRTISGEVESVKTLVDEFSQFARFPAAQPVLADLNDVVLGALSVFEGRLDGIELRRALAPGLPPVMLDRDQFRRVIVNLIDNAAEAMQDSPLRQLVIQTQIIAPDSLELVVADTGHGISPEDRERLFLPYFSTKNRGTGLGLSIVHHILSEHGSQIRVEDNLPSGARFVVEIPVPGGADWLRPPDAHPTEAVA